MSELEFNDIREEDIDISEITVDDLISPDDEVNYKVKKEYLKKVVEKYDDINSIYSKLPRELGLDIDVEFTDSEIEKCVLSGLEFYKRVSLILFSDDEDGTSFSDDPIPIMYVAASLCYKYKLKILGNAICGANKEICRKNIDNYDKALIRISKSNSPLANDAKTLLVFERYCFFYCSGIHFFKSHDEEIKSVYSITDIVNEIIAEYIRYINESYDPDKTTSFISYFMLVMKKVFSKIRGNSRVVVINDNTVVYKDKVKRAVACLTALKVANINTIVIADFINLKNYCKNGNHRNLISPVEIKFLRSANDTNYRESDYDIDLFYDSEKSSAKVETFKNPESNYLKAERDTLIEKVIRKSLTKLQSEVFLLYLELTEEKREFTRMKKVISKDFNLTPEQKAMAKKAVLQKENEVFKDGNSIEKEIASRYGLRVTDIKGWISDGMRIIRDSEEIIKYFGKERMRTEYASFANGGIFDKLIEGIEVKTW